MRNASTSVGQYRVFLKVGKPYTLPCFLQSVLHASWQEAVRTRRQTLTLVSHVNTGVNGEEGHRSFHIRFVRHLNVYRHLQRKLLWHLFLHMILIVVFHQDGS
jgi:hypothetical protein